MKTVKEYVPPVINSEIGKKDSRPASKIETDVLPPTESYTEKKPERARRIPVTEKKDPMLQVKKKDVEQKKTIGREKEEVEQTVKRCEIEYLEAVQKYRKALKIAHDWLKEERQRTDIIFKIRRLFKKVQLPKKDKEDLEALWNWPTIVWKESVAKIRDVVIKNGGDEETIRDVLGEMQIRIIEGTEGLSKNQNTDSKYNKQETMISNELTHEYEEFVFGDLSELSTSTDLEKHKIHLKEKERREKEDREKKTEAAEIGKFVPVQNTIKEKNPSTQTNKFPGGTKNKGEEVPINPEKTIAALTVLNEMKEEGKSFSAQAMEMMKKTGQSSFNALKSVGTWYNNLSKKEKIFMACSVGAVGLGLGALAGAAFGSKLLASALVLRSVKRGIVAAGIVASTETYLLKRAAKRKEAGLEDDLLVKHKELFAVGAGITSLVLGRLVSAEVGQIIKNVHVPESIKSFFTSTDTVAEVPEQTNNAYEPDAVTTLDPETVINPTIKLDTEIPPTNPVIEETTIETEPFPVTEKVEIQKPTEILKVVEKTPTPKLTKMDISSVPPEDIKVKKPVEIIKTADATSAPKTIKKEILINDKLGKRGNSIWGSLKHNGVSERAIANYEKHHPRSINKFAGNRDKISFIYDKQSDTLKEVKIEKALKRVARKATTTIISEIKNDPSAHKGLAISEHGVTSGEVHQQEIKTQQLAEKESNKLVATAKKAIRIKHPVPTSISSQSFMDKIAPLPVHGVQELSDPEQFAKDGTNLFAEGKLPQTKENFIPFNRENIETVNPVMATEIKKYFGDVNNKSWKALSSMKVSEIVRAKTPEELRSMVGIKNMSLQDARSAKEWVKDIAKERIRPKRGEDVFEYVMRVMNRFPKGTK
ncbi:MAG: hypothetical protein V4664_01845 [Patescibacteria group bacterium]